MPRMSVELRDWHEQEEWGQGLGDVTVYGETPLGPALGPFSLHLSPGLLAPQVTPDTTEVIWSWDPWGTAHSMCLRPQVLAASALGSLLLLWIWDVPST